MKKGQEVPYGSRRHPVEAPQQGISRRRFLKGGVAALAAVVAGPKTLDVLGDVADYLDISPEETRARQRERYAKEDKRNIRRALRFNEAIPVKEVHTDSGMKISVYQAQTGWNPDMPLGVDSQAMNTSINFMIGAMGLINDKNGQPIKPERIRAFQQRAEAGQLDNINMTAIMSATTGYHSPSGNLAGGGSTYNVHSFSDVDPRKMIRPLILFSPDIYNPGDEVMTPEPSSGRFPDQSYEGLGTFSPTAEQYLTGFFVHETGHVLLDAMGSGDMYNFAYNKLRNVGDYSHKKFVSPLSWYHTAAMAGQVADQPAIPPSFTVPQPWNY